MMEGFQKLSEREDLSLVIVGEAGQGLNTLELLLSTLFKHAGYFTFSTKELMSRIRGGCNSTEIRLSQTPCAAFLTRIDLLIVLSNNGVEHLKERLSKESIVISPFEADAKQEIAQVLLLPFLSIAEEIGNKVYANSVAVGLICYLFNIDIEQNRDLLLKHLARKEISVQEKNFEAIKKGVEKAKEIFSQSRIETARAKDLELLKQQVMINGAESIALGAIAGGCNFVCAYPMSPSTAVLVNLAKRSHQYGIGVEQIEDEICAANMALGAWYAGGRALVTTSGGGFALMCEAVSLSGITETPFVVMIGQRPGPATGLPTRTEQGDLNLVLYAGHGEFPRIILAPGSPEQGFELTKQAFNWADQFQVPVFILTDQYLLDSYYLTAPIDEKPKDIKHHIVKTDKNYRRYQLSESPISPRGIPGYGEGIVSVDSDEHTEEGYITEEASVRVAMQNKRMKKLDAVRQAIVPPNFYGEESYDLLLICWGSNYFPVKEAIDQLNRLGDSHKKIAMLHAAVLYPLHSAFEKYLTAAKKIAVIENNSTGQFAQLIHRELNIKAHYSILQYNGSPFSVEQVVKEIQQIEGDAS